MAFVVRRDHPRVRRRMTRELFNALPHIDVHVALGRPGAAIAWPSGVGAGARAPARRADGAVLHDRGDGGGADRCIAALPDRVAVLCTRLLPLKRVTAAFPMPRLTTVMVWHEPTDADPGARFFRQLVAEAVRG